MKRSIGILVIIILLGVTGKAQTNPQEDRINYVVSTTKIPQLQPILLTAKALKEEDGARFGSFQIVLYGSNVREEIDTYACKAKAVGAEISVCKLSLERLEIDPAELHEYITVVDHAFTHLIQLQKNKNYYSLQL